MRLPEPDKKSYSTMLMMDTNQSICTLSNPYRYQTEEEERLRNKTSSLSSTSVAKD